MLMHRVPTKDWNEQLTKRQVLSKKTTIKLVHSMMACRPAPPFFTNDAITLHIFDQTYKKKGASRGKHRAAEQVDASGDLIDLISMVIVNSVSIPLPMTLGNLTAHDRAVLQRSGPYCKPLTGIIPLLHPTRVKANLYSFMSKTGTWLEQVCERFGLAGISDMKVAHVARAAVGRPNVIGGRIAHFVVCICMCA
jgi:hypothetical protein